MAIHQTKYQFGIILALCLPVTIACIDVMAVSVAFNNIMIDFSISMVKTQWLLSGYTIGTAAFMMTVGKLADIYGRRKLLLIGIFIFAASSLMAALANSINILILSRFAQGLSSAMMMTTIISIITHTYPANLRGPVIAKWGFSCGVGMAAGPLVGGILIHFSNWRTIFLINIPICILAYLLTLLYLPESKDELTKPKIDWTENILLSVLLISLLTILSNGNSLGWTSDLMKMLTTVFFVGLFSFIFIELRHKSPIIDFSLFKKTNFLAAIFCGFASYFCMYAWLFIFSMYLQNVQEMSPLKAGLACSSFSVAFAFSAKLIGKLINKTQSKILIQSGFVLAILAFLWMTTISLETNLWLFLAMFFMLGIAITLINAPSMIAATEYIPTNKAGIASGIIFTIRWLGGSLGIVLITIIYKTTSYLHLSSLVRTTNIFSETQKNNFLHAISSHPIESINHSISSSLENIDLLSTQINQSLNSALTISCIALAGFAFIGLISSTTLINKRQERTIS